METRRYSGNYVGYKDGTRVPKDELADESIYQGSYEAHMEKLCLLQKVGKGGMGCRIPVDEGQTLELRKGGHIKKDHYVFTIVAEVSGADAPVYDRRVKKTTKKLMDEYKIPPHRPSVYEHLFGRPRPPSGGGDCPGGFCEP